MTNLAEDESREIKTDIDLSLPGPETITLLVQTIYPGVSEEDFHSYAEHLTTLLQEGATLTDLLALKQTEQNERQLALQAERLDLERKQAKAAQTQAEVAKATLELERAKHQRREARRAEARLVKIRQLPFDQQIASWNKADIEDPTSRKARVENVFALVTSALSIYQQIKMVDWLDRALNIDSPNSVVDYRRRDAEEPHSVWTILTRQMEIPPEIKSWEEVRRYLREKLQPS